VFQTLAYFQKNLTSPNTCEIIEHRFVNKSEAEAKPLAEIRAASLSPLGHDVETVPLLFASRVLEFNRVHFKMPARAEKCFKLAEKCANMVFR
jgi:hypothetical protein